MRTVAKNNGILSSCLGPTGYYRAVPWKKTIFYKCLYISSYYSNERDGNMKMMKSKKNMGKPLTAVLFAAIMIVSVLAVMPSPALAEQTEEDANGATTTPYLDPIDETGTSETFGNSWTATITIDSGTNFDIYAWWNQDITATYNWDPEHKPVTEIESVTMDVIAWDVDNAAGTPPPTTQETDLVYLNNQYLGVLVGPNQGAAGTPIGTGGWWTTTFVLISSQINVIFDSASYPLALTPYIDSDSQHNYMNWAATVDKIIITIEYEANEANRPPETPNKPWGSIILNVGESETYKTNTGDEEEDQIYYWFDWGDGSNSNWIGPYDSGRIIDGVSHSWTDEGYYDIRVKAKDTNGAESEWSAPLRIVVTEPFYFVHITDTHIGESGARELFDRCIAHINSFDPKPAFVLITGDLVNWGGGIEGIENYAEFLNSVSKLDVLWHSSPGNHDHYGGIANYYKYIDDRVNYPFSYGYTHFMSLNSGSGASPPIPPRGSGLSDYQMNWLKNELVLNQNKLNKIIFMHHPAVNKWNLGTIKENMKEFIENCSAYDVDVVLTGHTHKNRVCNYNYDQGEWVYDDSNSHTWISDDDLDTIYVQTGSCIDYGFYRNITVIKDHVLVKPAEQANSRVKIEVNCPVNLHAYDSDGNHVGKNETGGIDFQIDWACYSNKTIGNHTVESISIDYGLDSYTFIIEGIGNGTFNLTGDKYLKSGGFTNVKYKNVTITENSIGIIYTYRDSVDYTIYMDDDGDGTVNMLIQPDEIVSVKMPYPPSKPSGPVVGFTDVSYTYSTNTTDPEDDQIYYMFDWGDGKDSGWLGPFDSGEPCSVFHSWTDGDIYTVRTRAKDVLGHISDWSPSLKIDIYDLEATIDIDPDTLNLNSSGKWITCYIEFPEGYNVSDINISTILLNDVVHAEDHPTNISDYDDDGIPDLMVKFDRQEVIAILEPGENVAITVTGQITGGAQFEGIDYIRVI